MCCRTWSTGTPSPAVVAGEVACPHCGRACPVDDLRDTHPDAPPEAWTAQCPLDEAPEDAPDDEPVCGAIYMTRSAFDYLETYHRTPPVCRESAEVWDLVASLAYIVDA